MVGLPFMHQGDMGAARYIRMNTNREDEIIVLPIVVLKVVFPDSFDVPWVDISMTVGGGLDEHHRRKVINVPAPRNLNQPGRLSLDERLHPGFSLLGVIDLGIGIANCRVVALAIVVPEAVVVLNAVL
jgi:hypothetical protein